MATPGPESVKSPVPVDWRQFYVGVVGVLIAASMMTFTVLDRIDKQTDKITQAMIRAALADDHIQNLQAQVTDMKSDQKQYGRDLSGIYKLMEAAMRDEGKKGK